LNKESKLNSLFRLLGGNLAKYRFVLEPDCRAGFGSAGKVLS